MNNDNATLPHILVVDDVPAISKIAGLVLRKTGKYRISYADSGQAALNAITEETPDLILLDIDMPEMGGYEVCEQLKASPEYCGIPIIFLSAMDSTSDMVTGFKKGGADYITKPFTPAILLARVETHLSLHLTQQREQKTKHHLENILTSMNEGLVVIDAAGKIQKTNPKLLTLCGREEAALLGHPFDDLFIDRQQEHTPLADRTLQHPSGEQIPVRIIASTLPSTGSDDSQVLLIHDLRELLSAESARQANQAKDNFLASMSHELRTPLASIIGNSELLIEQLEEPKLQELAQAIEIAGRNQLALIKDVLEISKIESGSIVVEESPYDLTALSDALSQLYAPQIKQAGLAFQLSLHDLPEQQPLGDHALIQQILHNLLSNALKFTEHGTITLSIWSSNQQLHFKVEDSGIGIPPEVVDQLFQRFQQADNSISRRFGGSGLGLYIADNLATEIGGTIEVKSTESVGSTFQLNLPYQSSDQPAILQPGDDATGEHEPNTATHFQGRVLIAEDTPEMWMLVENLLQGMGIETTIAKNGQEAMELALGHPFDLILMDMQMPVMDGIEATTMLRQVGYTQPISALTANVMPHHRAQFEEAGCNNFLNKPIDRQALLTVLRQHLQPSDGGDTQAEEETMIISDELQQIFMDRLTTMAPALESALRYEQWDEVRAIAHNIKGSGTTFGYPEMTEQGKNTCNAIDHERFTEVPELAATLLKQIQQAIA